MSQYYYKVFLIKYLWRRRFFVNIDIMYLGRACKNKIFMSGRDKKKCALKIYPTGSKLVDDNNVYSIF